MSATSETQRCRKCGGNAWALVWLSEDLEGFCCKFCGNEEVDVYENIKENIMSKVQMKFEYTNEYGYKTVLEKESDGYTFDGELNTLLYEFANFLVACGFSQESIREKVLYVL